MDSEAQSALARLNGLLDELDDMCESSVGNLESRLSAARSAIEKTRNRSEKAHGGATTSAQADTASTMDDAEREALLSDIATYEQRVKDLEKISEKLSERDDLIARLREQVQNLEQRDSQYDDMDAKLMEYDNQVAALEESLKEREAQIESLKEQVQDLLQRDSHHDSADAKLIEYDNQVAALKERLTERETQIELLKAQVQDLEERVTEGEESLKSLESEMTAAKEQADELTTEVFEKDDELRGHREAATSLQQVLQERDATITELEEKVQQNEDEMKFLADQLEKAVSESGTEELMRELSEKKEQIRQLEGAARIADEEHTKLELEVKMLLGEIEGLRYESSDVEMLRSRVEKLEKDLAEERAVIVRLKAQQTTSTRANKTPPPETSEESEETPAKRVRTAAGGGKGRRGHRKQMGEILVEAGVLTEQQLQEVIAFQTSDPKRKLGTVVVERGYATEEVIAAALAAQLHVRFIENLEDELQPGVIKLVPTHLINNHRCVPLSLDDGRLLVAMANPLDLIGIENIELATNLQVEAAVATSSEIDKMAAKYFAHANSHK